MIVLKQFLPLALGQLTDNRPPIQEGKQTSQEYLQVPVKVWDLTRHQWETLIAMEGRKLRDTKSSAVVHQACT